MIVHIKEKIDIHQLIKVEINPTTLTYEDDFINTL